jgi:hypothetical protein
MVDTEHVRPVPVAAPSPSSSDASEALVGRNALIGAIAGFLTVLVGITIGGTLAGLGVMPSLGIGLFVGAFGGTGFGFMMGATVQGAKHG